jgi:hypothetical protein
MMKRTARKESWKEVSIMTPGHIKAISRAAKARLLKISSSLFKRRVG